MVNKTYVDQYLKANANLTPLKDKRPVLKKWQSTKLSEEKIRAHKGNLGWVLSKKDLVIDIDPRNKGSASFEKLADKGGVVGAIEDTVKTAGGGFHIYLSIPQSYYGCKLKKQLKDYPGIDFLSVGAQCVIAGSKVEKGRYKWVNGGFYQTEAPSKLLDLLIRLEWPVSSRTKMATFEPAIKNNQSPTICTNLHT